MKPNQLKQLAALLEKHDIALISKGNISVVLEASKYNPLEGEAKEIKLSNYIDSDYLKKVK